MTNDTTSLEAPPIPTASTQPRVTEAVMCSKAKEVTFTWKHGPVQVTMQTTTDAAQEVKRWVQAFYSDALDEPPFWQGDFEEFMALYATLRILSTVAKHAVDNGLDK